MCSPRFTNDCHIHHRIAAQGSSQIVTTCSSCSANITVSDLLWTIHWPANDTIADLIENVKTRLTSYLSDSDVYLARTTALSVLA